MLEGNYDSVIIAFLLLFFIWNNRVEIRTNCNVEVTFHNKMKSITKERADVSLS